MPKGIHIIQAHAFPCNAVTRALSAIVLIYRERWRPRGTRFLTHRKARQSNTSRSSSSSTGTGTGTNDYCKDNHDNNSSHSDNSGSNGSNKDRKTCSGQCRGTKKITAATMKKSVITLATKSRIPASMIPTQSQSEAFHACSLRAPPDLGGSRDGTGEGTAIVVPPRLRREKKRKGRETRERGRRRGVEVWRRAARLFWGAFRCALGREGVRHYWQTTEVFWTKKQSA